MAPTTSEKEDAQLRIMKTIQSEETNKKWEGKGFVFAHAAKWKRSTVSDVMILQELEMVREENKAMKEQVNDLKREQGELTSLVRQISGVILGGNQEQETGGAGKANRGGRQRPQERIAKDWSGDKGSKKPKSDVDPLPGSKEYADAKNGAEAEEKKIKRVRTVMNADGTDLDKVPYEVPKSRYRPQKIPEPERIRLKTRNEEETSREVIFCGIPSPPKYVKDTPYETAKLVMVACDELKTRYLGNHYGININSTDIAFAQRQIGHFNKKFTPITARFRKKETAERVLAAAKFINILNKRGTAEFGKHREPKEYTNERDEIVKPKADVVQRFENSPTTFIKVSRTFEQQKADKAARDHRETKAYIDRQKVKEFKKEQRISQAHFEAAAKEMPVDDDPDEEHNEEQYGKIPEPPENESFHSTENGDRTPEEAKKAEEAESAKQKQEDKGASGSQPNAPK